MGLIDWFKNLTGQKALEAQSQEMTRTAAMFSPSRAPSGRSKRQILETFHDNPVLRMAVSTIADRISRADWKIKSGTTGDVVEDADLNHPLLDAFKNPTSEMTGYVWRHLLASYLDTIGEIVLLVVPSDYNKLGFELLPIPPTSAVREREYRSGEIQWRITLGDVDITVPPSNIVYISYPKLLNPYARGTGVAEVLVDELLIEDFATEHIKSELFNHAQPAGIVNFPGADDVGPIKDKWYQEYGGPHNSGKVMFTGVGGGDDLMDEKVNGGVQYIPIARTPADMQTLELRENNKEMVRQTYGIPPEILGDAKDSNRATITAAETIFSNNVLMPRLTFLAEAITKNLMPLAPAGYQNDELEPIDPAPEDTDKKRELLAVSPGSFQHNEVRRWAGEEPLDELDGQFVQPAPSGGGFGGPDGPPGGGEEPDEGEDTDDQEDGEDKAFFTLTKDVSPHRKSTERLASQLSDMALTEEQLEELHSGYELAMENESATILQGLDAQVTVEQLQPALKRKAQERMGTVLSQINDHTAEKLQKTVVEGIADGENPRKVQRKIKDLFEDMSTGRATRIARTEALSATNAGAHEAMVQSDVVDFKAWLSTRDSKVRDEHEDLDRATRSDPVAIEVPFEIRGATAMHPGDFGKAELDIHCRCTIIEVFPDDDEKAWTEKDLIHRKQAYLKRFDAAEERLMEAVQRSFAKQLEKVLEVYDRLFLGPND